MYTPEEDIKALAKRIATGYPFSDEMSITEYIWAIESAWLGTNAANKDWQDFGQRVMKKYQPSADDIEKLFYGDSDE